VLEKLPELTEAGYKPLSGTPLSPRGSGAQLACAAGLRVAYTAGAVTAAVPATTTDACAPSVAVAGAETEILSFAVAPAAAAKTSAQPMLASAARHRPDRPVSDRRPGIDG
jgi:hypothetical protein